jgi:hypothetical protein
LRAFAVVLFACYVTYVPLHLATTAHLDELAAFISEAATDHHHHGHGDHDASHPSDNDRHVPHPAGDHTLNLVAQSRAPHFAFSVCFVLPIASVFIPEPEAQPAIPVFERSRPPGVSPPDPLQPRAPPLA